MTEQQTFIDLSSRKRPQGLVVSLALISERCRLTAYLHRTHLHFDLVVYFCHMDEKIEERFNQLEKRVSDGFVRMEDGFTRLEILVETLANSSAREFLAISDGFAAVDQHFEAVDGRLAAIEGSIEAFAHRVDNEAEERHVLAERVLKLENAA
jgi:hypothetical protein